MPSQAVIASLAAYGYDAVEANDRSRRTALDMATACFGFATVRDRLASMVAAFGGSPTGAHNLVIDLQWYNDMRSVYGDAVSERYEKYRVYEVAT